jgi:hypothetical protein
MPRLFLIDQYKLKVRYRGSGEVAEVHVAQLAIAPASKNPGPVNPIRPGSP